MIVRWDTPRRLLGHAYDDPVKHDLLSSDDQRRLASVSHRGTQRQMAAARVLLRLTLADHRPSTTPQSWQLSSNDEGAPRAQHPRISAPPRVSMTHTHGLVAVAIGPAPCGVDVESFARAVSVDRLVRRFFPMRERRELGALDASARQREFILRWTAREAWVKAEESTFLHALARCEAHRDANDCLVLRVPHGASVRSATIFAAEAQGFAITAVGQPLSCDGMQQIGRVEPHTPPHPGSE